MNRLTGTIPQLQPVEKRYFTRSVFQHHFNAPIGLFLFGEPYLCSMRNNASPRLEKTLIRLLQLFVLGSVLFGAVKEADTVWMMGDIGMGLMAWVNVAAIILLSPKAFAALKEYESRN